MASKTKSVPGKFKLLVYDAFEGEFYQEKTYKTEDEALESARDKLSALEKAQPSTRSGGQEQSGIQDRVFIQYPNGRLIRVMPE